MNLINKTRNRIEKSFFEKIAKITFSYLNEKGINNFDVVLVSNDEIRQLNNQYRKLDKVTDVLTFEIKEGDFWGQIFVCLDQVEKQAIKRKINEKKELAEIFVHGLLHLIGYDDQTQAGYDEMVDLQKKILQKLNF